MSHLCLITQKQKPPDFMSEGFFTPEKGVVPKVRVELTRVAPLVFETRSMNNYTVNINNINNNPLLKMLVLLILLM